MPMEILSGCQGLSFGDPLGFFLTSVKPRVVRLALSSAITENVAPCAVDTRFLGQCRPWGSLSSQSARSFRLERAGGTYAESTTSAVNARSNEEEIGWLRVASTRSRRDCRIVSDSTLEEILDSLGPEFTEKRAQAGNLVNSMNVIQYLLSLWIGKKSLLDFLISRPEILDADLGEINTRVSFFLSSGCTAGEIGSAIVRNSRWLSVPMERIHEVVAYLVGTGVPADKVPKVILKFPGVLEMDLSGSVQSLMDCLNEIVPLESVTEKLIERQPLILELTDKDVHERIEVLTRYGLSAETISTLLLLKPGVLLLPPDMLSTRLDNLQRIMSPRRLPNVFKVAPGLLTINPDRINKQYERLGARLTLDTATRVVNSFPQALTLSWEKVLLPKIEYLEALGLEVHEVINFPAYLGYSLPDRIKPRCELLLEAGYKIRPHSEVVKADNEKKLRKFGRSHKDILEHYGAHSVAIQHIVGLRDDDFESQFGVKVSVRPSSGQQIGSMEEKLLEDSDFEELYELSDDDNFGSARV